MYHFLDWSSSNVQSGFKGGAAAPVDFRYDSAALKMMTVGGI